MCIISQHSCLIRLYHVLNIFHNSYPQVFKLLLRRRRCALSHVHSHVCQKKSQLSICAFLENDIKNIPCLLPTQRFCCLALPCTPPNPLSRGPVRDNKDAGGKTDDDRKAKRDTVVKMTHQITWSSFFHCTIKQHAGGRKANRRITANPRHSIGFPFYRNYIRAWTSPLRNRKTKK